MMKYFYGAIGSLALLVFFFSVTGALSGIDSALSQFREYWYFLIFLSIGFGVQVALYARLRELARTASTKVLIASGSTSAVAMISCCAHYLTNLLPILAASGAAIALASFQEGAYWLGLLFNLAGIVYAYRQIKKFKHEHTQ